MTLEAIRSQTPSPALDLLVHRALGLPGRPAAYSEKESAALKLLQHIPALAGRMDPTAKGYDPDKPYLLAHLAFNDQQQALFVDFSFKAPTLTLAICKGILAYTYLPHTPNATPQAPKPEIKPAPKIELEPMPIRSDEPRLPTPIDIHGQTKGIEQ